MEPASRRAEILLVDEQSEGLTWLEAALAPLAHELILTRSSEETLREILRRDLALIVAAGPSGVAIAQRVRQHPRGWVVPLLVVGSGRHAEGPSSRPAETAPIELLPRGVDPEVLRARASVLVELQLKSRRIKTLERALRQRAREARRAIIVRDQFLSVASHELRTPLTSLKLEIANLLRLVRRENPTGEGRLLPRVERIDAQAARLHRLIDELLDASRIAAGHLDLELEEVDLSAIAREVVGRFAHEATRLGSSLEVTAPAAAIGYWDRSRLDQVLSNLISNAIKYGDGKPIEVSVEVSPEEVLLRVRDNGVGIAPQDQARIFERFERAASIRNYGGIGLGLWSVHQIVDALGGRVMVESQPDLGATFTVSLPRARPAPTRSALPFNRAIAAGVALADAGSRP